MRRLIALALMLLVAASAWADADDAYTVDLLHFDGSMTNEVPGDWHKIFSIYGNATSTASTPKFGSGALVVDGDGDYILAADSSDWAFGTGSFTIDCWLYVPSHSSTMRRFISQQTWPGLVCFRINNSNRLNFQGGSAAEINLVDSSAFPTSQWVHVAVSRDGSDWRMFRDGALVANASSTTAMVDCSANRHIGGDPSIGGEYFTGYIDEVRVTKGIARWTAPFTPPSEPYGTEPVIPSGRVYLADGGRIYAADGGRIKIR